MKVSTSSPCVRTAAFGQPSPIKINTQRSSRVYAAQKSRDSSIQSSATESFNMLEAFFIGRALAETVNERLGNVAGDVLAEFGKLEAEFRRSTRDFQDEVLARARREMAAAAGASDSPISQGSSSGQRAALAAAPDLGEAVDNLRAEVASTRALVQQLKQQPNQKI